MYERDPPPPGVLGRRDAVAAPLTLFTRIGGYVSIVGLTILFLTILFSSYWIARLSHEIGDLDAKRAVLVSDVASLTDEVSELTRVRDRLNESIGKLSALAQSAPASPNSQSTIRVAENARFTVRVWGYRADSAQFSDIVQYLNDQGYTVTSAIELDKRQPWLAYKSMVLYYSSASKAKAREIADQLARITGTTFGTDFGGGIDVPKGSEKWNFRVHFIGQ